MHWRHFLVAGKHGLIWCCSPAGSSTCHTSQIQFFKWEKNVSCPEINANTKCISLCSSLPNSYLLNVFMKLWEHHCLLSVFCCCSTAVVKYFNRHVEV